VVGFGLLKKKKTNAWDGYYEKNADAKDLIERTIEERDNGGNHFLNKPARLQTLNWGRSRESKKGGA